MEPEHNKTAQSSEPKEREQGPNESWDAMISDWQSQPYERADTDKLIKQLTRRTRIAKWMFASNILATLFIAGAWAWFLFDAEEKRALTIFSGVIAVFSFIYTVIEFKIRKETWAMDATDPEQIFNKGVSSAKGALQYTKLWLYSSYILLPLGNWFVWERSKTSPKDPIPFYIFINVFLVVLILIGLIYQKRRKKELENLESFLEPRD